MAADRHSPEVIAARLARMRDDTGRPILPMAPGTALCLVCTWVPWSRANLPTAVQGCTAKTPATPPSTRTRIPQTGDRPRWDGLCGATRGAR